MINLTPLIALPLFLLSFGILEDGERVKSRTEADSEIVHKEEHNVIVKITGHTPYCGGAAPTFDQMNNYYTYQSSLILIDLNDNTKTIIKSSGDGYYLSLPMGKYAIKEAFKDVPFKSFVANHEIKGMYYMEGTEECYKNWWKSNLFEFEVTDKDSVIVLETTIGESCFTGNNPCVQYTGPYPP
jgi:hypothetical protein